MGVVPALGCIVRLLLPCSTPWVHSGVVLHRFFGGSMFIGVGKTPFRGRGLGSCE